jgi:LPXTG-motif cell wall-anchored protein
VRNGIALSPGTPAFADEEILMSKTAVAVATILMLGTIGLGAAWSQTGSDPYATDPAASQGGTATTAADPATTETTEPASESGMLPETASPWPLISLVGFGSLGAGLILRRRRS